MKQRYRQLKIKQKKTLNETGISELWDNLKTSNIHIIDTSTGIKREETETIFGEIIANIFPNLMKMINTDPRSSTL